MRQILFFLLVGIMGLSAWGEETFPKPVWQEKPSPMASSYAYPGGEISIYGGPSPDSLNYYLDTNVFSATVFTSMYETLISADPITLDDEPWLAEKWTISDDKKTFTFWIDPKARWSDGKPITAEDVKWTFETILDPKNLTGPHKVDLEVFEAPEILEPLVIRFTAREVHWRNLGAVGGMAILPKHAYQGQDFNLINFEFPVISGLYRLGEIRSGIYITMERREDWWRAGYPKARNTGNFQTLRFQLFESNETAFESFLKGQVDLYPVYTSRMWVNETVGEKFAKNWIVKQKVTNYDPVGFQGFAMNMRRPLFEDVRVRKALCHLLNREEMNATIMYNQYFLHRSYYEDLYDEEHPCPNQLVPFDKAAARALLKEAGWQASPATGVLEKDGRPFRINFLARGDSSMRFLSIYQQDLKDVGIVLEIDQKDWAAWSKDMDEYSYDMTWAAWGAGVRKDPESMWHSREADRPSGHNITGFKDPRVDELIERQKTIFDIQERHAIVRQIDQIIYDQFPYVLLWNTDYTRLLYWNKFGTPATVLSKYGDERSSYDLWWFDEDAEADLEDAMNTDRMLPPKGFDVDFDERFKEGEEQP
ncbi:ABC transporter substrate-binding protein [bacterium]|nr:ABC transporter substrate-binding protein [bacterium]